MPYVTGYMKVTIWVREGDPITPDPPGEPTHPIVLPPGQPPYPDQGLPPFPAHPIVPPSGTVPGVPTHPIVLPPDGPVDPGYGLPLPIGPEHPIVLPPPSPAHPIVLPPDGSIGGTPEHPIYFPPVQPGVPAHPIALPPDGSIGGTPEHPIYIPAPGTPEHPIVLPQPLPVVNSEDAGSHPMVPDLNMGFWAQCVGPRGVVFPAFVQYEPGEENPQRPDSQDLPGVWVTVLSGSDVVWAWAEEGSAPPHVSPSSESEGKGKKSSS